MQKELSGVEGIKTVFESALECEEGIIRTALVGKPLVYLAGEKFAEEYMRKRKEGGVVVQSLRFSDTHDKPKEISPDKEIRYAPRDIKIKTSLVIWDDNVVEVNVGDEISIFWTENAKYVSTKREWYESIWKKSD